MEGEAAILGRPREDPPLLAEEDSGQPGPNCGVHDLGHTSLGASFSRRSK